MKKPAATTPVGLPRPVLFVLITLLVTLLGLSAAFGAEELGWLSPFQNSATAVTLRVSTTDTASATATATPQVIIVERGRLPTTTALAAGMRLAATVTAAATDAPEATLAPLPEQSPAPADAVTSTLESAQLPTTDASATEEPIQSPTPAASPTISRPEVASPTPADTATPPATTPTPAPTETRASTETVAVPTDTTTPEATATRLPATSTPQPTAPLDQPVPTTLPPKVSLTPGAALGTIRVAGGSTGAYIRQRPTMDSPSLVLLRPGVRVEILEVVFGQAIDPVEPRWYHIQFAGLSGYAYYKLVKPD